MRRIVFFLLLCAALPSGRAAAPELLERAVRKWMDERNNWAFTQRVIEFEDGTIKEDRKERYDPSKPGAGRWQLLSVNGRPPTVERLAEWMKRKARRRINPDKTLNDYLALDRATVVKEDAQQVCYHVPLLSTYSWIFPIEKVDLRVTIDKQTLGIQVVEASTDAPFRVALGFAQVLNVDFDVQVNPSPQEGEATEPAAAKPDGTAKVVITKLGERVEYAWSEFRRVKPHPDNLPPGPKP